MVSLDNSKTYKKLDRHQVADSINLFAEQLREAYLESQKINLPMSYKKIKNILINGMGGSAYCGYVLKALYDHELKVPVETTNSYNLPGWVNQDTLVVTSSYSGTTEETVNSFYQAQKRKAKIIAICQGELLARLALKNKVPSYIFSAKNNPSNQPRIGLGYTIVGLLGLFAKINLINFKKNDFNSTLNLVKRVNNQWSNKIATIKNPVKSLALKLNNRRLLIIGAEHLAANAHILANQLNETSKTLAAFHLIPELNHHLMEGIRFPISNKKDLAFLFLDSEIYDMKIKKRFQVTKKVVAKNEIKYFNFSALGKNTLEQTFSTMVFSGWLSYYLGILNNVDPVKIPWVDYFKNELAK